MSRQNCTLVMRQIKNKAENTDKNYARTLSDMYNPSLQRLYHVNLKTVIFKSMTYLRKSILMDGWKNKPKYRSADKVNCGLCPCIPAWNLRSMGHLMNWFDLLCFDIFFSMSYNFKISVSG